MSIFSVSEQRTIIQSIKFMQHKNFALKQTCCHVVTCRLSIRSHITSSCLLSTYYDLPHLGDSRWCIYVILISCTYFFVRHHGNIMIKRPQPSPLKFQINEQWNLHIKFAMWQRPAMWHCTRFTAAVFIRYYCHHHQTCSTVWRWLKTWKVTAVFRLLSMELGISSVPAEDERCATPLSHRDDIRLSYSIINSQLRFSVTF